MTIVSTKTGDPELLWRTEPTLIPDWPDGVSYCLFVDESGTSVLKGVRKCLRRNREIPFYDRFFIITGCAMRLTDYTRLRDSFLDIKKRFWRDGEYFDTVEHKTKPVVFRSYDLRKGRPPFRALDVDQRLLASTVLQTIDQTPFELFSATIDKRVICSQNSLPQDPYELGMTFILERYAKFRLGRKGKTGAIMFESRGREEDKDLHKKVMNMLDVGTRWVSASTFGSVAPVLFSSKIMNNSLGLHGCAGLELADLCCYPFHRLARDRVESSFFRRIEKKIHGYPRYIGYGLKRFP